MSEENKDIAENIFSKKLGGYKVDPDPNDWAMIEARLEKKRFYRLSFFRFNIYYSIMIIGVFLISLFSLGSYLFHISRKQNLWSGTSDSVRVLQDTVYINNRVENGFEDKSLNAKRRIIKITGLSLLSSDSSESKPGSGNDRMVNIVTDSVKSSSSMVKDSIASSSPPVVTPKKKKIIYVVKQDTIIKIDTVRNSKRKK